MLDGKRLKTQLAPPKKGERRMGSLYKRGEIWWVKYYENGRPRRESTGTEKETEARRFLKEREGRVATGQPILQRADRIRYEGVAQDLRQHYRMTKELRKNNLINSPILLG
jgi:hypothetical protein